MIDTTQTIATCKVCGEPIKQGPGGHRPRVFCKPRCRMKDMRERKRAQNAAHREADAGAVAQIATLQARIASLEKFIDELAAIEEAFNTDTSAHNFLS